MNVAELETVYSQFEISLQVLKLLSFRLCVSSPHRNGPKMNYLFYNLIGNWLDQFYLKMSERGRLSLRSDETTNDDNCNNFYNCARQKATLKYAKRKEILPLDFDKVTKNATIPNASISHITIYIPQMHILIYLNCMEDIRGKERQNVKPALFFKHGIKIVTRRIGIISFGRRSQEE